MAGESVNRRRELSAEEVAEQDFQSFSEALGSSARGRAFLAEYARRNRHADTEAVLGALTRLEETALRKSGSAEADRIRQDLRALLDTLRTARPQTENSPTAIKAATLAALIDFTQARIEAVIGMPQGMQDGMREIEAVVAVPSPDEPELPIPHPKAADPAPGPIMALVHTPPKISEKPVERAAEKPVEKPVEKQIEKPNIAVTNSAVVAPLTKVRELTGIPIVEFDYAVHQAARPAQPRAEQTEEAWTALTPPSVVAQKPVVAPVAEKPAQVAPKLIDKPVEVPVAFVPPVVAPEIEAAPQPDAKIGAKIDSKPAPETYELWLDEPVADVSEPAAVFEAPVIPAAAEFVAEAPVAAAPVAQETTEQQSTAQQPVATSNAPAPAMTAIEALVQQMEKTQSPAAPVPQPATGKVEFVADPLAPITALSEEERIALFT